MLLLGHLIARYPTAKRQTLRRMVEQGRVSINGERARSVKATIAAGDQVVVDERPRASSASLGALRLIFEDADILVVSKPPGLLTSTVPRERRPTAWAIVRRYLAADERTRAGLIHRLDRDASGLLVFSKNHLAYESLKRQFFEHSAERVYMAMVHGRPTPPAGRIESRLVELPDGSVRNTRVPNKGEQAVTEYQTIKTAAGADPVSLLRVTLQTGRKHQIRFHLSSRGHPIVGDSVYGSQKTSGPLLLAATRLALAHPRTGERMTFEIEPPSEMRAAVNERFQDPRSTGGLPVRGRGKRENRTDGPPVLQPDRGSGAGSNESDQPGKA